MDHLLILLLLGLALIAGGGILWFVLDQRYARQLSAAQKQLRQQLEERLRSQVEAEHAEAERIRAELQSHRQALEAEAAGLAARHDRLAAGEAALQRRETDLQLRREGLQAEQAAELERLSQLSPEQARAEVLARTQGQIDAELSARLRTAEQTLKTEKDRLATEILTRAVQRTAVSHAREQMQLAFELPDASWRGRVIGKEGRTVQALQAATGADFSLDDERPAVWISSFDPWRRELARRTLQSLIETQRLHPARIEAEARLQEEQLEAELPGLGADAAARAGVGPLPEALQRALGRLHYRRSFGQDLLQHSVEVALLAGQLALQLHADPEIARRGGLLHDLGKALSTPESDASHTALGVELAQSCGESPAVLHTIAAHHFETEPHSPEALIVQVADTLSAARPGARSEQLARHVQRLGDCERIALGFAGVRKAWVLRAGREVKVLVDPDEVPEQRIRPLAGEIARAIGQHLQGQGQVKVSVVREIQASDYAR